VTPHSRHEARSYSFFFMIMPRLAWPTRLARRVPSTRWPNLPGRPVGHQVMPAAPTLPGRPVGHQVVPSAPTLTSTSTSTSRGHSTSVLFSAAPFFASATTAAGAQQASASAAHTLVRTLAGAVTGTLSALFTAKGVLAMATVGVMLGAFHFTPRSKPVERAYASTIVDMLEKVAAPSPFAPGDVLLDRPHAAAALASALDPADGAPPGFFIVVTGPPGSGKTTLVRLALMELAKRRAAAAAAAAAGGWEGERRDAEAKHPPPALPSGAAYVSAAALPRSNFGRELAAAVGFGGFEEGVRTLDLVARLVSASSAIQESANPTESLARAASALEEAARDIKSRGGGRPLLVIDAADHLAYRDPDALLDMVEIAKAWAESGLITVAFVVSDSPTALNLMKAAPGFSRAAQPISVDGPSVAEAGEYLGRRLAAKGGGALPGDLADLVAAIHDNWLLLQKAASLLVAGSAAADVRARLVSEAEVRFAAIGVLDRTPHAACGLALAHALSALPPSSSLPPAAFHRLCPNPAAQDALLLPEKFKGGWAGQAGSPFRYEPGVGLSFASAVDAAYVRSGVLERVAYGGVEEGRKEATRTTATFGEGAGVEEVE